VTHNSLAANQRPNISLIDRRHFDDAALPIRISELYNWRLCKRQGGHSPLDSFKPYQRSRFAAPHAQRSKLKASVTDALLDRIRTLSLMVYIEADF
jgi:hypothetical protein